jgi:hypothetical protein
MPFRCYFLDDEGHIKDAEYLHVEALNDASIEWATAEN